MQNFSYAIVALVVSAISPTGSASQSYDLSAPNSLQGFNTDNLNRLPDINSTGSTIPNLSGPRMGDFDPNNPRDALRLYQEYLKNNPTVTTPVPRRDINELYERYVGKHGVVTTPLPPELAGNEGYAELLRFYDDYNSTTFDVLGEDGRVKFEFIQVNGESNPALSIQNGEINIQYTDISRLGKSVALVTATKNVSSTAVGEFTLATQSDDLCPEVKFSGSLIAGHCTAFLAFDQQTIVTANHCIPDQGDYSIVFDFSSSPTVDSETVFQVDHTSTSLQDAEHDLAILRLDRPVPSEIAEPLEMNLASDIQLDTRVGIIGHPMGMGKIVEFGDESRVKDVLESHFLTNNDAFHGNSGSPVFNQETLAVEGILQQGQYDLVKDIDRNCTVIRTVDADGADNNGVVLGFQTALMSIKAAELRDKAQ